jgi:L-ascorbate metabolism protein UlaG (beta-lactamase superfamily)
VRKGTAPGLDTEPVSAPELHFLGHSTVRVELAGRTVLTDPLLTATVGPLRRVVPPPAASASAGVDLVLLSHLHGDHLHLPSLRLLGDVRIVVPRGAGRWLRDKGFPHVEELAPGETLRDGDLTITGVHARHSGHRWGPRLEHGPQTRAMGHLLSAAGRTVYCSGDTDLFDSMTFLGDLGIDVAVLPVWGWGPNLGSGRLDHGHLDPHRAAEAVARLRPRTAVPVHWGTFAVRGSRLLPRMRRALVEPPRVFAAEVAARGLGTTVLHVEPGTRVPLPVGAR